MLTLDRLGRGQRALVRACHGGGAVFQRLCEMGLVAGTPVRLVRVAPLGDPIQVEVNDFHLSLRRAEASSIEVELVDGHAAGLTGAGAAANEVT